MKSAFCHIVRFLALLPLLAPALQAKSVTGHIVAVFPDRMQMKVQLDGEETPLEVFAGLGDLRIASPDKEFRGQLVRQGSGWRLENIFPADADAVATIERLGDELKADTHRRGRKVFRSVGERMPAFALWDQNGELFLGESLKGDYAVINFVFTRCTMPDMCPASTSRMLELAAALEERGWDDVRLVSITLDPAYDTPGIWTSYALTKDIDTERHTLLGGPATIVEALKKQMGVLAEPDPEQIIRHTMSTALIDPSGKIIYRLPGSMWRPSTFIKQIEKSKAAGDNEAH